MGGGGGGRCVCVWEDVEVRDSKNMFPKKTKEIMITLLSVRHVTMCEGN